MAIIPVIAHCSHVHAGDTTRPVGNQAMRRAMAMIQLSQKAPPIASPAIYPISARPPATPAAITDSPIAPSSQPIRMASLRQRIRAPRPMKATAGTSEVSASEGVSPIFHQPATDPANTIPVRTHPTASSHLACRAEPRTATFVTIASSHCSVTQSLRGETDGTSRETHTAVSRNGTLSCPTRKVEICSTSTSSDRRG